MVSTEDMILPWIIDTGEEMGVAVIDINNELIQTRIEN